MSSKTESSRRAADVPLEEQLDWLRTMLEIRNFEDECHRLFARGLVRG
jgi:TPP-dependent pyruvate/acetoin dehydrogenase alpha subunit